MTSDQDKISDHATMLAYFHEEKGDMTRYIHFDEAIDMFPQIKNALFDANYYNKVLDRMVKELDHDG